MDDLHLTRLSRLATDAQGRRAVGPAAGIKRPNSTLGTASAATNHNRTMTKVATPSSSSGFKKPVAKKF